MTNFKEKENPTNKKLALQQSINDAIKMHQNNILWLLEVTSGIRTLKGKSYSDANENYEPNDDDKRRLPKTVLNIVSQIVSLKNQLE